MAKIVWKTGNQRFDDYTQHIADAILKHLEEFSASDEHFNACYKKENKTFDECMVYVINMVWLDPTQSSDDCCYQNARHYYLEDNIEKDMYSIQKYNNNKSFEDKPKKAKTKAKETNEEEAVSDIDEEDIEEAEEEAPKPKPTPKPKAKPKPAKVEKKKVEVKPKEEEKPKPKEVVKKAEQNQAYAQIDIFSLLGD